MPTGEGELFTVPLPIFVFPNNQQHIHYKNLTSTSPIRLLHLFAWPHGFGIIFSDDKTERALLLRAAPPGHVSNKKELYNEYRSINIAPSHRCMPGTNKSYMGFHAVRYLSTENSQQWNLWLAV